jgi:hypothetical protein
MAIKETDGVRVDEARDQEFSFRQVEFLQLPTVSDVSQERFFRYRGVARGRDLVDGLDETVVSYVDECVGERVVRTVVGGGDERTGDEERHFPGRVISTSRGQRYEN